MTKKKPIILQVLPSLISGGVERGTIEIAQALIDNDYESYVASSGGPLAERLDEIGVEHLTLPSNSKNPYHIIKNIFLLTNIIRKYNIDIIHARSRAPAWSCYFASLITGCKFITSFHGIYNYNNFLKKFYNSIMTRSDKIIAVSNYVKDHIEKNYNKYNIELIHRGADINIFDPSKLYKSSINEFKKQHDLTKDIPIIILPGRLTRWKGHIYLIEAIEKIESEIYCLIIGDDKKNSNYKKELQELIKQYQLEQKILFLPNQSNMPLIYKIADIVISASTEPEAFGRIIVEAQAMECLTIATNIGGACETIIHDKTGWLIDPSNSQELTKQIEYVLGLPDIEKDKIRKAARENIISNFSTKKMTDKTLDLYNNI